MCLSLGFVGAKVSMFTFEFSVVSEWRVFGSMISCLENP